MVSGERDGHRKTERQREKDSQREKSKTAGERERERGPFPLTKIDGFTLVI